MSGSIHAFFSKIGNYFNLKEENGKNALVFSSPSIENTVKFLEMITINQSLSVTSMTIKPEQGIFNFTIYFDIAK